MAQCSTTITGPYHVCVYTAYTFSVNNVPGTSYNWTAWNGGIVVSGQGTSTVQIMWNTVQNQNPPGSNLGSATVQCMASGGCNFNLNWSLSLYGEAIPNYQTVVLNSSCIGAKYANQYHWSTGLNQNNITGLFTVTGGTITNYKHVQHWDPAPSLHNWYEDTITVNWTTAPCKVTWWYGYQPPSSYYNYCVYPHDLIVNPTLALPVNLGPDVSVCASSHTINAGSGYASYLWNTGATTHTINVATGGDYSVTVTGPAACGGGTFVDTVNINFNGVPPVISITPSGPTTFCTPGSVALTATTGASYLWSNGSTQQSINATASGTYIVTVTDAGGCSDSAQVVVTANTTPSSFISGPTTICPGTPVTLTAFASGNTYAWSTGATTQSISVSAAGTYTCTITSAAGCSTVGTKTLTSSVPAQPIISIGGATTFCQGGSVILTLPNAPAYLWSTGATTQSITVTASGTYTGQVANAAGCYSLPSNPVTIVVNPNPAPTITATNQGIICPGGSVTLTATAGFTSYSWSTGAITQSITVSVAGTYSVGVTNSNGCAGNSPPYAVTGFTSCSAPIGMTTNILGPTKAIFSWAASPCAYKYMVNYRKVGSPLWMSITVYAPTTSLTVNNLGPNTSYEWKVRAFCVGGVSPSGYSASTFFTTPILRTAPGAEPAEEMLLTVYPNPSEGEFNIEFEVDETLQTRYRVLDIHGKTVLEHDIVLNAGPNRLSLDLKQYPAGLYFFRIRVKEETFSLKLMKME